MCIPPFKPRVHGRPDYPTATLQFHGLVRNAQARLTLHALTYPAAAGCTGTAHRPRSTSAGLPCSRPTLQTPPTSAPPTDPPPHAYPVGTPTPTPPHGTPTLQTPPRRSRRSRLARPSPDLPTYPTGPSPRTRRPPCLRVPPELPCSTCLPCSPCRRCGLLPRLRRSLPCSAYPAAGRANGSGLPSGPAVPGGTPYSAPPTTPPHHRRAPPRRPRQDLPTYPTHVP
jgi:hypothetical protein